MKWEADLRHGFFGVTGGTRGRWWETDETWLKFKQLREDIGAAFEEVQDVVDAFFRTLDFPESQPFSGGVLDSWPARMVDGLALARREWAAVKAHHEYLWREEEERRRKRG